MKTIKAIDFATHDGTRSICYQIIDDEGVAQAVLDLNIRDGAPIVTRLAYSTEVRREDAISWSKSLCDEHNTKA